MAVYDVRPLKEKQNKLDERRRRLLEVFVPFRDEVLSHISEFISEAQQIGLREVEECQIVQTERGDEVRFMLAGMSMVAVSPEGVYRLGEIDPVRQSHFGEDAIAARLLIYSIASEGSPLLELSVSESRSSAFAYYVGCYSTRGWQCRHIQQIAGGSAARAAASIVAFFYEMTQHWLPAPPLPTLQVGEFALPPLGFVLPDKGEGTETNP